MDPTVEHSDDGHYVIIGGRRWRATDPGIPDTLAAELRRQLMAARRDVGRALKCDDADAVAAARGRVQDAKVALGERGPVWWDEPDENASRLRALAVLQTLVDGRPEGSVCPSEVARVTSSDHWRALMPMVRELADELDVAGQLEITQRGRRVHAPHRGPIRFRRPRNP